MATRFLILGAGPAGLTATKSLHALAPSRDIDPEITIVSAEPFPPYSPPAMADYFVTGNEKSLYWQGTNACEALGATYRSGVAVKGLDPKRQRVALADGSTLDYDRLLIATGSRLYAPLKGHDRPGVNNFKSLTAARALVEHAKKGEVTSALVVGAGFIGVEVAILLNALGLDVTLIERYRIMPGLLDDEMAELVLADLRQRGITVFENTEAARFKGRKRVRGVKLADGRSLYADACIAATGIKPNVEYLDGSGLDIDWGIRVDNRMRTNLENVWAAGDIAETFDRETGERYVHAIWPNARMQGEVVARDMLGFETQYAGAERMNSMKHLGLPIMAVGSMQGERILTSRDSGNLRKIYLTDNRITGFRLAGDIRGAGTYRALMLRGTDVARFGDSLLDPRFHITRCVEPGVLCH